MIINDYLADINEKQMFKFLETCFGSCLDGVTKYYDDSYGGYLFKIQLNGGIDYLPKERNNTLRVGRFGLVKDDKTMPYVRIIDNFEIAATAPNFFKKYVGFIAEEVKDKRINNKAYLERLKEDYLIFLMFDKMNKMKEIEESDQKQKQFLKRIISEAENKVEVIND